jgi:hypothetical protein
MLTQSDAIKLMRGKTAANIEHEKQPRFLKKSLNDFFPLSQKIAAMTSSDEMLLLQRLSEISRYCLFI